MAAGQFPATGQTSCYDIVGDPIPCAGTGQDGDIQAGATPRYKDNGNGTITDKNTRLVWEKQSYDGSIHDHNNVYTWEEAFTKHVATLNTRCANNENMSCSSNADCPGVGGQCGFAGKQDWRVPNYKELVSILNLQYPDPSVPSGPSVASSAAFATPCVQGVTVKTGSCTAGNDYWSSTSYVPFAANAWFVNFLDGHVGSGEKNGNGTNHVRAVRGGFFLPLAFNQ